MKINKFIILCLFLTINFIFSLDVANDSQLALIDNKYARNNRVEIDDIIFGKDISKGNNKKECLDFQTDIYWETQLLSTVGSTPLIVDLLGDGDKEIIVFNTVNYIDVIRGKDGDRVFGFPFILEGSTFSSSPLVYDKNKDSKLDIIATTRNGEILFIESNGLLLSNDTLKIPPLKVKKLWYELIDQEHVDASLSLHNRDNKKNVMDSRNTQTPSPTPFSGNNKPYQAENGEIKNVQPSLLQNYDESHPLFSKIYNEFLLSTPWYSSTQSSSGYVFVDAHVFSTPIIVDIDDDGSMDLIVSVSYYFDQEFYSGSPSHKSKFDSDLDFSKYVAGGIVCFDLVSGSIKWQTHLDLTTDHTAYKGYIYSSPTIVDIDSDGKLDILIGTGLAYIYALDRNGIPIIGNFPLLMDSIYSQVVAHDINSDGKLEIIASDTNGNVVSFDNTGDENWEGRIYGKSEAPVSIGDIDGDGQLDVVVGSFGKGIWAWNGKNGSLLNNFPIKLKGELINQITLLDNPHSTGMILVAHAGDGVLYSINGASGCVNKIDLGDWVSFSTILSDDLNDDGLIDLVLLTYSGKVFLLSTNLPFQSSLQSFQSFDKGRNNFQFNSKTYKKGVTFSNTFKSKYSQKDIITQHYLLEFEIFDSSYKYNDDILSEKDKYSIIITYGNYKTLFINSFSRPGLYQVELQSLNRVLPLGELKIHMVNQHKQYYYDTMSISFNNSFFKIIKWVLLVPIGLLSIYLILNNFSNSKNKDLNLN